MRFSIYILIVAMISCNSFSKEREQQSKIDSLMNEVRKKDSMTRRANDLYKQDPDTTLMVEERDSEIKKGDVVKKEIPKKKVLANPSDREIVEDNSPVEVKNEGEETNAAMDERNAVRKRVIIEKPTFKPLTFGGFKDIKFNFFNNYGYELDEVILKVHYIRVDGSEIKSEAKILKDINANSRLALTAPDYTSAGRELKVTLEAVQCKAINLCFYSMDTAKSDDPYKCH